MYTTRVPRPRALRPRHSVVSQWDVLLPLGIAPPDPEIDATEMPEDPGRGVGRRSGALPRRRRSRQSRRGGARERRQSVPPLAVGVFCRAGAPARVKGSEAPYHPHVRSVRRGGGGGDRRRRASPACTGERQAIRRMRRVRSRRASRARRTGGAVYRRRQRTASYRGNDRRAGCGVVWTDACRCDRSRFEARGSSARRQKCRICRAVPATSGGASPAIFVA